MRPNRSLFVPLLLILLGALLLVRSFHPQFPFWDLVARYWPVLLVVWGLAKLAGALRRQEPGTPGWRPSLSIGEFFLALFIVMVGLSASQWVQHRNEIPWGNFDIDWPWSQRYTFTAEVKHDLPARATVYFENYAGDVHVAGTDAKDLSITITKQVRSESEEEARKLADTVQPEITQDGTSVTVRIPARPQYRTDLQVAVPKNTPLRFDIRRGSVEARDITGDVGGSVEWGDASVSNIQGNVRFQLRRGSLNAQNIAGNVELEGRGNDIQVADVTGQLLIRGSYSGASDYNRIAQGVRFNSDRTDMEIQKLPGRLEMTLGSLSIREPGGSVTVSTRNKEIRIEDFDERVQITNHNASVELSTTKLPLKDIEVENHSGPIEISLPARSEFQLTATAQRGEVESDFGPVQTQTGSDTAVASARIGKAGGTVKLTTSYGSIRVRKLGSEATAPVAPAAPEPPKPPRAKIAGSLYGPAFHPGVYEVPERQALAKARVLDQRARQRMAVLERRAAQHIAQAEKRIGQHQ